MMRFTAFVQAALILATGMLAACAGLQRPLPIAGGIDAGQYQRCADFFSAFDQTVHTGMTHDAQYAAIAGFPYLRADRFLASFGRQQLDDAAFEAWVDGLQKLDVQSRNIELQNLPSETRRELAGKIPDRTLEEAVLYCGRILRRSDMATEMGRQRLLEAVHVPYEYQSAKRLIGLYPLTSIIVAQTIRTWHDKTHRTFDLPLSELPVHGELVRYVPPPAKPITPEQISALIKSSRDRLGVPRPEGKEQEALFAAFAPVWEVEVASDSDRIGAPEWRSRERAAAPQVDTNSLPVYRHVSYTRLAGRILLQLNYIIWFQSRPEHSAFDILGGHLDGITWRVTLGEDGQPLMYDVMHNCGCYHMFFPSKEMQPRRRRSWSEPPLIPQAAPELSPTTRLVIRVASDTHYVQRAYVATIGNQSWQYHLVDYDVLRSLPLPGGGHRSLFDANGIVPSSYRGERWLIWPMGIPAPGSMRQWGHHANAFIGRRHFDDSDLLDTLFKFDGWKQPADIRSPN